MDNWDYARDQHWSVTIRQRIQREADIARFDGATTTPSARDTAWCERNLGDVPHRSMTLTCNAAPVEWAEVADVMRLPSGEAASEAWRATMGRDA